MYTNCVVYQGPSNWGHSIYVLDDADLLGSSLSPTADPCSCLATWLRRAIMAFPLHFSSRNVAIVFAVVMTALARQPAWLWDVDRIFQVRMG